MAGINAHNKVHEKDPFVLKRSDAYIGVLIDDLVTKGTQEPYRMFTSRAEYRILLRQDNADLRLTEIGNSIGLASEERLQQVLLKKSAITKLVGKLQKIKIDPPEANTLLADLGTSAIDERASLTTLLKRPQVSINDFRKLPSSGTTDLFLEYSTEVLEQAEILIKYDSYIQREQILAEKLGSLEDYRILPDFDYDRVKALSLESREKLKRIRPETIGQASRISGVSPADVSVLTIYMGK